MFRPLPSPNWPAECRGGEHLHRHGLLYFGLLSLLVHGLILASKFDFQPFFPVDRGRADLSVELRAPRQQFSAQKVPTPQIAAAKPSSRRFAVNVPTTNFLATAPPAPAAIPGASQKRQSSSSVDTTDLIERCKAELNAASRRQMLDPMFAPVTRHSQETTPLARSLAPPTAGERRLGENGLQLTTADGRVHCLQRMPEVVARDIPGGSGAVAIPVSCPIHF